MTKRKDKDIDTGLEPERLTDPERAPKETDRDWPLPPPPVETVSGPLLTTKPGYYGIADLGESLAEADRLGLTSGVARPDGSGFVFPGSAEALLIALESRCANGGSATLVDIRACLKALRGE